MMPAIAGQTTGSNGLKFFVAEGGFQAKNKKTGKCIPSKYKNPFKKGMQTHNGNIENVTFDKSFLILPAGEMRK